MDIYISSIPFKWKDKNLLELFSQFGHVTDAKVIIDNITRQNKGFGFVTMPNDKEGNEAISQLHNTEHEGRMIIVQKSVTKKQEKTPRKEKPFDWRENQKLKNANKKLPPWVRKEL